MEGILMNSPRSMKKTADRLSAKKLNPSSSHKHVRIKNDPTKGSAKHIALYINSLQNIQTLSD